MTYCEEATVLTFEIEYEIFSLRAIYRDEVSAKTMEEAHQAFCQKHPRVNIRAIKIKGMKQ